MSTELFVNITIILFFFGGLALVFYAAFRKYKTNDQLRDEFSDGETTFNPDSESLVYKGKTDEERSRELWAEMSKPSK